MQKSSVFALVSSLLLLAQTARADFSGETQLGSAGSYNLATGVTSFGAWQSNFTTDGPMGGSAVVNTNSAPNSLTLSLTANGGGWDATWEGFAGVANLTFSSPAFTDASVVSFTFNKTQANYLGFHVEVDGTWIVPTSSSTYSFELAAGQDFQFVLNTSGWPDQVYGDPENGFGVWPGESNSGTLTVSNFDVAPVVAAVPEPSSSAALFGLVVLGGAALHRKRRDVPAA